MRVVTWLGQRDRDFAALRRAGRAAIVMPGLFVLSMEVVHNPQVAAFAGFGSFAMLLLVDFGGPMVERLQAQAAMAAVGAVFVCLGTLASRTVWLAVPAMVVVGFGVLFAGVVSSSLARATTALLLSFILPVSLPGPVSSIPDRLAGWGMAGGLALVAVALAWPAPAREPLRGPAVTACRAFAARLRTQAAYLLGGETAELAAERDAAATEAAEAVDAVRHAFLATLNRPTGLSTPARTVVRLVDEMTWLHAIITQHQQRRPHEVRNTAACEVKSAAATVLEQGADLLSQTGGRSDGLRAALTGMRAALSRLEEHATTTLPVRRVPAGAASDVMVAAASPAAAGDAPTASGTEPAVEFISSLEPGFRAQELSFAVSLIARDIALTAAAERRSWLDRLLGRQPEGLPGTLAAGRARAASHLERHSVWLHNSLRGAAALGLAVLVADFTGVQHSFWVVLGALSVLRSNALTTGDDALRAVAGTAVGFVAGAALLVLVGTNATLLWVLLPVAVLLAGLAPAVVSFAGGQAAFTLTLVILFNILQPSGWRVGLYRVEDVALGCLVSLAVGLLFWPRGAGAALRQAMAEAYHASADYLADAVRYGMSRCEAGASAQVPPAERAAQAAAAARRLDDAFRTYLAERGAKPVPLAAMTRLVTGVAGLRLASGAVLDLWRGDDVDTGGDRTAARREVLEGAAGIRDWYADFASRLASGTVPARPLPHDVVADGRLVRAVRADLHGEDGRPTATAVRVIWTADHLDAARRLQEALVPSAWLASSRVPAPL